MFFFKSSLSIFNKQDSNAFFILFYVSIARNDDHKNNGRGMREDRKSKLLRGNLLFMHFSDEKGSISIKPHRFCFVCDTNYMNLDFHLTTWDVLERRLKSVCMSKKASLKSREDLLDQVRLASDLKGFESVNWASCLPFLTSAFHAISITEISFKNHRQQLGFSTNC
jgi:hypothetical protein